MRIVSLIRSVCTIFAESQGGKPSEAEPPASVQKESEKAFTILFPTRKIGKFYSLGIIATNAHVSSHTSVSCCFIIE